MIKISIKSKFSKQFLCRLRTGIVDPWAYVHAYADLETWIKDNGCNIKMKFRAENSKFERLEHIEFEKEEDLNLFRLTLDHKYEICEIENRKLGAVSERKI